MRVLSSLLVPLLLAPQGSEGWQLPALFQPGVNKPQQPAGVGPVRSSLQPRSPASSALWAVQAKPAPAEGKKATGSGGGGGGGGRRDDDDKATQQQQQQQQQGQGEGAVDRDSAEMDPVKLLGMLRGLIMKPFEGGWDEWAKVRAYNA